MINIAVLASHNGSGLDTIYNAYLDKILDINIKVLISNNTTSPALQKATNYGIDNYIVNNKTDINVDERIYALLKEYECEYVLLAGYMKKLSPKITDTFKVINSHPSLLPKYGGAGMYGHLVHEAVVKNNEKVSGVTVHEVNEHYDEGKIILQKELFLSENEDADSLEIKVKKLEKLAIVEAFRECLK